MNTEPEVSSEENIEHHAGYKSLEQPHRPTYWGIDLDRARRPGVPMMADVPRPMTNARMPIDRQQGTASVWLHGRPNREFPPVFSTAVPMRGLSGVLRRYASRIPDHKPSYWLIKLFSDRVDLLEHRAKKFLPLVLPVLGIFALVRRVTWAR